MNPFLARVARKQVGEGGRKSEKRVAARLGAKQTIASGNQADKGDYRLPGVLLPFRGENKATQNLTMALDSSWLAKIKKEARNKDESAMLTIDFINPDGSPRKDGQWVCVPLEVFKEMLGIINEVSVHRSE